MKKITSLFLVLAFIVALASCGKTEITEPTATGDDYVLPTKVINSDISLPYTSAAGFNPYSTKSSLNRDLIPVMFESLFNSTDNGKGKPVLALNGEINDKNVTVKLNQGIKFCDGSEFTSADVKNSFEKAKACAYYKSELSNVSSVSATDNYTVVFKLNKADAMALNVLNFPIAKADGKGYIGTGKYKLAYLDEQPYLAVNKEHKDYKDSWNQEIALYDMAGVSSPVYPFKANKISLYKNDLSADEYVNLSSKTVSQGINNLVYIGVNSQWAGSVTSVESVRQAINIGINRKTIAASSFLGQGTATVTPFKSDFYQLADIDIIGVNGSLEKALGILERAGYTQTDSDGVRSNGVSKLNVNIIVCTAHPYKLTVAESFKSQLEKLGFGVTINKYKTAKAFNEALKNGRYSFYVGEVQLTSNCDLSGFFTESGALNYGIDEEMYDVYKDYKNSVISTTGFIESFSTKIPFLPLFYRKAVVSVNPNISGISEDGELYSSICDWKISKSS